MIFGEITKRFPLKVYYKAVMGSNKVIFSLLTFYAPKLYLYKHKLCVYKYKLYLYKYKLGA